MALLDFLFGRTKPVPTTTTTVTSQKLPEEIAPFVKEVLEEAQQIYGERREQGYQEFPGETIAPRTPEELAAIEGLRGLVGTQEPYRAEQEARLRATPTAFTTDQAEAFMNPYQQAVIDVAKRRAVEDFERVTKPQFEAQAVQAGGMSGLGTRAGVQAGVLGEALQRQLGDIQAIGQQKAFEDAYKRFGDQVERERVKAADISGLGTQRFNIGLAERGLQQELAQTDRAEAQALLNEQFAEFIEREQFPESSLAQYSSFVYGNPFLRQPDTTGVTQGTLQPSTSMGQQLLGLGLTGLNIFGRGGGFGQGGFSPNMLFTGQRAKEGGRVGGGLASLPVVNRRNGTQILGGGGRGSMDPSLVEALTGDPAIYESSPLRRIQSAREAYRTSGQPLMSTAKFKAALDKLEAQREGVTRRQQARRAFYDDPKKGLQSLAPTPSDPMSPISAGVEAVYEKPTDPEKVAPPGFIEALSKGTAAIFKAQDAQKAADKKAKADFAKLKFETEKGEMLAQQQEDISVQQLQDLANLAKETLPAAQAKEIDSIIDKDIANELKFAQIRGALAKAAKDRQGDPIKYNKADMDRVEEDVARSYEYKIIRNDNGEIIGFRGKDNRPLEEAEQKPVLAAMARARTLFVSEAEKTRNKGKAYDAVMKAVADGSIKNPIISLD